MTVEEVFHLLAEYEDIGLEPKEVRDNMDMFHAYRHVCAGHEPGHIRDLLQADKDGRIVVLPCAIDAEVFTIEESYFDCENCEHGAKAKYDTKINRRSCGMDNGEHCPYYIEMHIAEGFTIGADDAGKPSISAPGEWDYEGLEEFSGIDGKWYKTREEAEAAIAKKGGEINA